MKRRLHLAIVTPFPPAANGIGRYGCYLSASLIDTGVFDQITVLTEMASGTRPVEYRNRIKIERIWQRDRLDAGWKIAARLQRLKPDLVWYNLGASTFGRSPWANVCGLLSPSLGRLAGLPTVVTLHEMVEQADLHALEVGGGALVSYGARMIRFLTTRSDVVCVTLRRHMEWLAARDPHARILHIPHGVFVPPELLTGTADMELLLFGNLAPFKGLDLLLDAFRALHRACPSVRLTLAGAIHPRFPAYLDYVRHTFGGHMNVRWLGYVPESAVRDIFAHATIVVLPYRATTGSSSLVYRAAGWGRPIVASDLPELRAVAKEEGLRIEFFPCGDGAALVTALERLLADPIERAAQAHHNLQTVWRRLTLAHTCSRYLQAFDLALAAHEHSVRIPVPIQHTSEVI